MDPKTLKLQKKWYAKLAKEGFEDIEKMDDEGEPMSCTGNDKACITTGTSVSIDRRSEKELGAEYYRQAGYLANNWPSRWLRSKNQRRARRIWTLHTNGETVRSIVGILKEEDRPASKAIVFKTIVRWRTIMLALPFDSLEEGFSGNAVDLLLAEPAIKLKIEAILKRNLNSFTQDE